MPAITDVSFIEMRIAKTVGFGPPLAERPFQCVVLDEVSGDRHVVFEIVDSGIGVQLVRGAVPCVPRPRQVIGAVVFEVGDQRRRVSAGGQPPGPGVRPARIDLSQFATRRGRRGATARPRRPGPPGAGFDRLVDGAAVTSATVEVEARPLGVHVGRCARQVTR